MLMLMLMPLLRISINNWDYYNYSLLASAAATTTTTTTRSNTTTTATTTTTTNKNDNKHEIMVIILVTTRMLIPLAHTYDYNTLQKSIAMVTQQQTASDLPDPTQCKDEAQRSAKSRIDTCFMATQEVGNDVTAFSSESENPFVCVMSFSIQPAKDNCIETSLGNTLCKTLVLKLMFKVEVLNIIKKLTDIIKMTPEDTHALY
jgi:hypothetical protein